MNIDEKELIELVYERRLLYDQSDPLFGNKTAIERSWEEVSEELGVPGKEEECLSTWERLKEQFILRVQMEGLLKEPAEHPDYENPSSGFRHYEQLSFLIDYIDLWNNKPVNMERRGNPLLYEDLNLHSTDGDDRQPDSYIEIKKEEFTEPLYSRDSPKEGTRDEAVQTVWSSPNQQTDHLRSNLDSIGIFFQTVEKLMRTGSLSHVELIETQVEIFETIKKRLYDV